MADSSLSTINPAEGSEFKAETESNGLTRLNTTEVSDTAAMVLQSLGTVQGEGRRERLMLARKTWVEDKEATPESARFAGILVAAQLSRDRQRQFDRLSPNERLETDNERLQLIRYDHELRDWLNDYKHTISMDAIVDWLSRASGDSQWAAGIVLGAAGEIALAGNLARQKGVKAARLSTLEEEADGRIDAVMYFASGKVLAVDVKTRLGADIQPEERFKTMKPVKLTDSIHRRADKYMITIPAKDLNGFDLRPQPECQMEIDRLIELGNK